MLSDPCSRLPTENRPSTPADEYIFLANKDDQLDPSEVDDVYSKLQPANPASLDGEWDMHVIDTGHPAQALAEDIIPLMSTIGPDEGAEKVSCHLNGAIRSISAQR